MSADLPLTADELAAKVCPCARRGDERHDPSLSIECAWTLDLVTATLDALDVPRLVAEVERLRAQVERVEALHTGDLYEAWHEEPWGGCHDREQWARVKGTIRAALDGP